MSLYGIILESVIAAVQIKSRPPTNHATAEGPVRPCGPVRFSVTAVQRKRRSRNYRLIIVVRVVLVI